MAQNLNDIEKFHAKLLDLSLDKNFSITYAGILTRTTKNMAYLTESSGVWKITSIKTKKTIDMVLVAEQTNANTFVFTEDKKSLFFKFYLMGEPRKPISEKEFEKFMGFNFKAFNGLLGKYSNRFQQTQDVYDVDLRE